MHFSPVDETRRGSGAVALFPILDFASDIYHKMSTFVQADIVEYQPLD